MSGAREIEKIRDDLAERFGFSPDALDIRAIRLRQRIEIEELAVAVNRREAVAEFVRDAGRQLADGREAVLETKLLLEIFHGRQIGEETDRAVKLAVLVRERRHGDAE